LLSPNAALFHVGEACPDTLSRHAIGDSFRMSRPNAFHRAAHSVVTGNVDGVFTSGGSIFSYGDNNIDGNTTDNTAILTTIPTH
jgi:hypothetical protein